jgi:hypothetical protein
MVNEAYKVIATSNARDGLRPDPCRALGQFALFWWLALCLVDVELPHALYTVSGRRVRDVSHFTK